MARQQGTGPALAVRGLTKRYRGRRGALANDGVELTLDRGRVLGLLGHNGAGKTTIVNQVVGLVRPDAGGIRVCGVDAVAAPHKARELASVQAQANVPITGLTPRQAVVLTGRLRGGGKAEVARRAELLLEALDLGQWADTPAQKVSGGVARLTAFCMTAVMPGRLVILDEPTNDVDPVRRRLLWDAIAALAADGAGVLLVTHNVREAERAVDDLVVLDRGRVLAAGTPAGLTAGLRSALQLEADLVPGRLPAWPEPVTVARASATRVVATVPAAEAAAVVGWAQRAVADGDLDRYALTPASLEDVYLRLAGPAPAAEAGVPDPGTWNDEGGLR